MGYIYNGVDIDDLLIPRELVGYHTYGGMYTWGQNSYGELATNDRTHYSAPAQWTALAKNWKRVSAGKDFMVAVKTDGTLWSWGYNAQGQLGDNSVANKSSPVQTTATGSTWYQAATGDQSAAAVKNDGTLWTWGSNLFGQLGNNSTTNRSSPVQTVAGGNDWKMVAAGAFHFNAIKTDGTLWSWGWSYGLGDNTLDNKSSPVQTVAGGTDWKQVSGSISFAAAVKTDGTLWLWGTDAYGQLGDNSTVTKSSPIQTVAGGTNWKQVSCTRGSIAALKEDGTLWTWGRNIYGELGDGTTVDKSSPIQTVAAGTMWRAVSGGRGRHMAAIKTNGTMWAWGENSIGQLGDSTTVNKSSPVQVGTSTQWKSLSCGYWTTVGLRY